MPHHGLAPRSPRSLLELGAPEIPALWRIAQNEASVDALYQILGEFCHTFRNRMNSLQLYLYLSGADRTGTNCLDPLGKSLTDDRCLALDCAYRSLLEVIDRLQGICRPSRSDPTSLPFPLLLEDRLAAWRRRHAGRVASIEVEPVEVSDLEVLDTMRLAHGLNGIADWRLGSARPGTRLTLSWRSTSRHVELEWIETYPADHPDQSGQGPDDLAGVLPLALLARLVSSHGGTMNFRPEPSFRLSLSWPLASEPERVVPARASEPPVATTVRLHRVVASRA